MAMSAPVQSGEILANKYVVEHVLGEGGMGIVVAALHRELGTRVAVKFLRPEFCQVPEAVGRFLREAQAAVQIQSEHVARVTDVGKLENGAPYMVMEFLRGRDLAAELEQRGQLGVSEVADYVLQACEAVAEAHALGIVHRDLKPGNLFLARRPDGTPLIKVLDFGISKARPNEAIAQNLTATQSVMGSPLYMSPEQLRSAKNVDHRTDVWAFGVILHELVSGAPPFRAETVSGLIATVVTDAPPPLRALRRDVPTGFEEAVLRCLEKDVSRRLQHVGELAVLLAPFASASAALSVQRITGILQSAGVATQVAPSGSTRLTDSNATVVGVQTQGNFGHTHSDARRSLGLLAAAVFAMGSLGALGLGGWLLLRKPAPPESAQPVLQASALAPAGSAPPLTPSAAPAGSGAIDGRTAEATVSEKSLNIAPSASQAGPVGPTTPLSAPVSTLEARGKPLPKAAATAPARLEPVRPKPRVDPLDGRR
jgi:serine/threonine-protein kinase